MTRSAVAAALLVPAALLVAAGPAPLADQPVEVPGVDWKARADAWFKEKGEAARKEEMRQITKALRKPCKHCHTEDFQGWTDKRLISQQMMALSAEHGVACDGCHAGKDKLTELGESSREMFALARERKVFCDDCHQKGTKFEQLTEAGRKFRDEQVATPKAP